MSNTLAYDGVGLRKWALAAIAITVGALFVAMIGIRYAAAVAPSDYGLKEGDTVSAAGSDDPDVYIVNELGYKRLFLNPVIFGFYGHLGGFAAVKSVTPATRDAFPTSGLFRVDGTEKVYGVETTGEDTGVLHWVNTSGAQAVADDANFFKKVFVINQNEFNWYAKSATDYTSVSQVPSYARVPGEIPGVPGVLAVSLAPDNPAAKTITLNAQGAEFLKVRLSGTGTVSSMTVKRLGAGQTNDFENVYIYDGATRLTSGKSFSSATGEITFISLNIAVSGTKDISVVADMSSTGNTAGNVNSVQLNAVTLSSGTVSGLPVSGNNFSSSGASSGTIDTAKVGSLGNPNVGARQAQLSEFKLTANTEAASVKRMTLIQGGSVKAADITNLKLKTGTQEWSGSMTSKGYAVFDLGSGFSIVKGGQAVFKVYGDLAGKATETIILYFENNSDLLAIGDQYGQGMAEGTNTLDSATDAGTLTLAGGILTINFVGPGASNIGTDTSDTNFLEYSMTAATNIEVRKTRLTLCWDSGGEGTYNAAGDSTNGWEELTDIKVTDKDTGAVVMGPIDGASFDSLAGICPDAVTGSSYQYTDVFDLTAGQTRNFKVTADVDDATTGHTVELTSADKIRIYLNNYADDTPDVTVMKYPDTNTSVADADIVPNADIAGPEMTLQSSSLTLGLAATPGSQTYVKGTKNVDMVGITFAAAQASDLKVNDVVLTGWVEDESGDTANDGVASAPDTAVSVGNAVSNIRLYEAESGNLIAGSDKISNNQLSVTDVGTVKFSFQDSPWTIPAGSTKTMLVRVDLSNNTASGTNGDNYSFDIAATTDVTALDSSSVTVNAAVGAPNGGAPQTKALTVKNSGTLTLSQAPSSSIKAAAYWGQTNVPFSQFRLTSTNEGQYVEKLTVATSNSDEAIDAKANVKKVILTYKNKAGSTLTSEQSFSSGASANFGWSYTSGTDTRPYVPKDSNLDILVSANLRTKAEGATQDTGAAAVYFSLDLTDAYNASFANGMKFVGEGSGAVLDGSSTGIADVLGKNNMYVYRVFPKIDIVALSSPYLLIGTPDVYKFTVTAMGLSDSKLLFDGENVGSGSFKLEVIASGQYYSSNTSTSFEVYDESNLLIDTGSIKADANPTPHASLTFDFGSQDVEIEGGGSKTFRIMLTNPNTNYAKTTTTGRAADYFQLTLRDNEDGLINWVGDATGSTDDLDTQSTQGYLRNLPATGPTWQR